MILLKGGNRNWNRTHYIALCWDLALEESMHVT